MFFNKTFEVVLWSGVISKVFKVLARTKEDCLNRSMHLADNSTEMVEIKLGGRTVLVHLLESEVVSDVETIDLINSFGFGDSVELEIDCTGLTESELDLPILLTNIKSSSYSFDNETTIISGPPNFC